MLQESACQGLKVIGDLVQGGKQAGKPAPAARVGSPLGPNGQQAKGAGRIDLGKAGSIACLEELEEAGKKKQMAEWSSDRYAARSALESLTSPCHWNVQKTACLMGTLRLQSKRR